MGELRAQLRGAAMELLRENPQFVEGRTHQVKSNGGGSVQSPDLLAFPSNDYGNARRFIELYGDRVRFCHAFQKWLISDSRRYAVDDQDQAHILMQETLLEFSRQALAAHNDAASKFAGSCLNSGRIKNGLREAQPHLAIAVNELDQDPYALNFLSGTVDLRSGKLRPHERKDFITKLIHHNYNPEAKCPQFLRFLYHIMGDTPDASDIARKRADRMVRCLQKALGYSLTGCPIEKMVFLPHGGGNNGKTTLLSTIHAIAGEYAILLQIETLMCRQENNNSQADLADLRGARFVMTSETEEGSRLAEGKLKRITQGMGKIKAVRKYENPFEFSETHHLWIDSNHRPVIRGNDNAIWNRLYPIPFEVTIAPEDIDRDLPAKLLIEAEGILAWCVAGAVQWCREGLGKPPEEVQHAKEEWRSDMDQIGRFIEECCITGEYTQVKARAVFDAYRKWAEAANEQAITETAFGRRLTDRGYEKKHTDAGKLYCGIGLRQQGGAR